VLARGLYTRPALIPPTDHAEAKPIRSVTVFCSARPGVDPIFVEATDRFGRLLAESGRSLVYGAGSIGLMGTLAQACRAAGGRVTGVITKRLRDKELMDEANDENIVVDTMRERKRLLEARGDAIVVLAGGIGTMEEFFEILVGRVLGEHDKPIVLLDTPDPRHERDKGYYDPLLRMMDHMIEGGFAAPGVLNLFEVAATPEEVIAALDRDEEAGAVFDRDGLLPRGMTRR